MSVGRKIRCLSLVGAMVSAGIGTCALAQPDAAAPAEPDSSVSKVSPSKKTGGRVDQAWFDGVVTQLDSEDYATREKASTEVSSDERVTLKMIEARLTDAGHPLTPEQCLRLSEAGIKMFANSQRGAMGVSFAGMDSAVDGVKVGGAVDGFDAKRVLRSGDVIREMDGVELAVGDQLRSRNMIVALIISHDPGDEIALSLIRGGEPVVVRLRLGNYRELRNANELTMDKMRMAWEMRCNRLATLKPDAEPDSADAGISLDRWAQLTQNPRLSSRRMAAAVRRQQAIPFMNQQAQPADDAAVTLVSGGSGRVLPAEQPDEFSAALKSSRNAAQAQVLQKQIDMYSRLIQGQKNRLKDGNLPDFQKRQLQAQVLQSEMMVKQWREEKKKLVGLEP